MHSISIRRDFKGDHITRIAGERLRKMILDATDKGDVIEVDFTGVVIASTSFFDEGFAKLAEYGWTEELFEERIHLKNIDRRDIAVMREMCKNRGMVLFASA